MQDLNYFLKSIEKTSLNAMKTQPFSKTPGKNVSNTSANLMNTSGGNLQFGSVPSTPTTTTIEKKDKDRTNNRKLV